MAGQVIVKDRKLKQLFAVLRRNRDVKVRIGIVGDDAAKPHPSGDITIGELAHIHEFGAPAANIPQRSYIRSTINENRAGMRLVMLLYAEALVKQQNGRRARQILVQAAERMQQQIIAKMDRGIAGEPEGPSRTLEDTRTLKDHIKVELVAS